jgi:hypothetical protein
MTRLLLVELTLGFIVFCADSHTDARRRPCERLVRSVLWMITLGVWFTHRNLPKLGRFAAIVWFLVTTGWLITLEYDRTHTMPVFLLVAQVTMGFVVYCVDALSADLHGRPLHRLLRSLFWMKSITDYMRAEESIKIVHASLTVWILLTTGWLLSLESDRIVRPLGIFGG